MRGPPGAIVWAVGIAGAVMAAAGQPPAKTADQPAATAGAAEPGQVIVVQSAGGEPRVPLRYTPKVGAKGRYEFHEHVDRSIEAGGQKQEKGSVVLDTTIVFSAEVKSVKGGTAQLALVVETCRAEDPRMTSKEQAALDEMYSDIRDVRGTMSISPRGDKVEVLFQPPAGGWGEGSKGARSKSRLDQFASSLQNAVMVLPDEPVGVGATWKRGVSAAALDNGKERNYELKSLKAGTMQIASREHPAMGPVELKQEGLPEGMKAIAESRELRVEEDREVKLSAVPLGLGKFSMELRMEVKYVDAGGKETGRSTSTTKSEMSLRRAGA